MKVYLKNSVLLLFISLFLNQFSFSAAIYTTGRGYQFTQIDDSRFGTAWVDPKKMVWSRYEGNFSNGGNISNDVVIDSPAVRTCSNIGGKLPSREKYQILLSYFLNTADYLALFPAPLNTNLYWTADAASAFPRFVKIAPYLDPYGDIAPPTRTLAVQCEHE